MLKKAAYIILILFFGNTIKGFAQVPLFIDDEDSTTHKVDTPTQHQPKNKTTKPNVAATTTNKGTAATTPRLRA